MITQNKTRNMNQKTKVNLTTKVAKALTKVKNNKNIPADILFVLITIRNFKLQGK